MRILAIAQQAILKSGWFRCDQELVMPKKRITLHTASMKKDSPRILLEDFSIERAVPPHLHIGSSFKCYSDHRKPHLMPAGQPTISQTIQERAVIPFRIGSV